MTSFDRDDDPKAMRQARCPICRKATDPGYRPFCSRRCADVDLARWLGGGYAVSGHADAEEDGGPLDPGSEAPHRH